MALTYTWLFSPASVKEEGDNIDVIKSICWTLTVTDGTSTAYRNEITNFKSPAGSFITFADLTENDIISFIVAELGTTEANLKEDLAKEILCKDTTKKELPF